MTKASLIAEPGKHEIMVARVFNAPRKLVFKAMPNAQQLTLEGQTHEVAAGAIAPVLVEFFTSKEVSNSGSKS